MSILPGENYFIAIKIYTDPFTVIEIYEFPLVAIHFKNFVPLTVIKIYGHPLFLSLSFRYLLSISTVDRMKFQLPILPLPLTLHHNTHQWPIPERGVVKRAELTLGCRQLWFSKAGRTCV